MTTKEEMIAKMVEEINENIEDIQSNDIIFPTEFKYIQEAYDRLIIPSGRKHSGLLRQYDEAVAFLTSKYGKCEYTFEEYVSELNGLIKHISEYLRG